MLNFRFISKYDSKEEMSKYVSRDIPNPSIGDAVIANNETFVYTGNWWELIGSYGDSSSIENKIENNIATPSVEHKCKNCGATLELDDQNGIFKCPYCKSKYSIRYI